MEAGSKPGSSRGDFTATLTVKVLPGPTVTVVASFLDVRHFEFGTLAGQTAIG